MFEAGLRIAD